MTIRIIEMVLAGCDTPAEAEQAKRAFENVLLPRFTRDEAIAIVLETMPEPVDQACEHHLRGIRLALEALAAAGVFSDSDPCPWCAANQEATPDPGAVCETCDGLGRLRTMADKLDAAGIR